MMSDASALADQIKGVRRSTLAVIDDVVKKARAYELPDTPTALEEYRLKLLDNTYKVLIVGEMKRGKSSFINALISRDILPTNVDIATCEVFRVSRASQEGYRLRFENGSTQEITAGELRKYGEQGVRDVAGAPRLDQIIRWIEVDLTTAKFLPVGVSILDTPGLGSLYAAHAQITQRFVPQADAVIFVLDAEKPIVESELEFIGKILDVTHSIFFVLTKIDLCDEDHWQQVRRRDETLLKERFKDHLAEAQIWPFSSANLRQAATTGDDIFLEVSYYQQLASALQAFLFKVSGWSRCADALLIADHYQVVSRKTLAARLAALEVKSPQQLAALQQAAATRQQDFDAEWGVKGRKRQELLSNIQRIASRHKQSFTELLEAGSPLEMAQRHKIDALKSLEEVKKLDETISEQVVTEVMKKWHSVCEEARLQCAALLAPLIQAVDSPMLPDYKPDLAVHMGAIKDIQDDVWDKFDKAQAEFLKAGTVAANAVLIALYIFPATVVPLLPFAIPAVVAAGVWAAIQRWKFTGKVQIEEAQQKLHERLTAILTEVRERFLLKPLYNGQDLVDSYFNSLIEALSDKIREIAEANLTEAQAASARLAEQTTLDEQQRKARAEQVQQQLTTWDTIGRSIGAIAADLKVLDQSV